MKSHKKGLTAITLTDKDPTAYQSYKKETGQGIVGYGKMVFYIMGCVLLFVFLSSKWLDGLMHDPIMGFVATGLVVVGFWQLLKHFAGKF